MKLKYTHQSTPTIKRLLSEIKTLKTSIDLISQIIPTQKELQRRSLLKSSVFSARIEGNQLHLNNYSSSQGVEKLEIQNIYQALRWLYSTKSPKTLTKNLILSLHKKVLKDISASAGKIRTQASAIFNQAGVAIYLSPPPEKVNDLISQLIKNINQDSSPAPIKAATAHFAFEKIHPFMDGNGRVGRLLSTFILKHDNYDFHGLVSLEEYLDTNRQTYYDLLNNQTKDITPFIEFFLEGIKHQALKSISEIKKTVTTDQSFHLPPRRQEILDTIKDHQLLSFNSIKRRFMSIPDSTLHHDLKQLMKKGLIKKLGNTRGALYGKL